MSLPQAGLEDLDAVKAWFRELADHVRAVDFASARHLFAEDFVAFGTFTDFMIGRELAEKNQWRNVWPTIDGFVWRLDDAKAADFDLAHHLKAKRAYAWRYAMEDGRRMFFAVLHIPPVTSPRDAVIQSN